MFALSPYILVHPFGLFTSIAHRGIFRLFTNIVFRVGSLYDFGFGLGRVPHQHGSTLPIRRDLFPNKLPLHSGMGYCTNPILRRHALSFSADNTFVSISDPFSSVWTFTTANSPSSTRSRIQWYLRWMCFVLEW